MTSAYPSIILTRSALAAFNSAQANASIKNVLVQETNFQATYGYDPTSAASPDGVYIIIPSDNPTLGRWLAGLSVPAVNLLKSQVATLQSTITAGGAGRIYADVATALADGTLPNGSYFYVPSNLSGGALDLYLKVSSSVGTYQSTLTALDALNNAVEGLKQYTAVDQITPVIVDRTNALGLGVNDQGIAVGPLVENIIDRGSPGGFFKGNVDGDQKIFQIVTDRLRGVLLGLDTVSGPPRLFGAAVPLSITGGDLPINSIFYYVPVYGESLSVGAFADPAISTSVDPQTKIYSFATGPRSAEPGNTWGAVVTNPGTGAITGLVEDDTISADGSPGIEGETISFFMMNGLAHDLASLYAVPFENFTGGVSTPGHGGYRLDQLMNQFNETCWYNNLMSHVTQMKIRAQADLSLSNFQVLAMPLVLGANDSSFGTDRATYLSELIALWSGFNYDVGVLNPNNRPIPLFPVQTSYNIKNNNGPALATLDAADAVPNYIHPVCPLFFFEYDTVDAPTGLHIINTSEDWLGAYFKRAIRQRWVEGRIPDKTIFTGAVANGTALTLYFDGASTLAFDTDHPTTDKGIKIIDSGSAITLSAIALGGAVVIGGITKYTVTATLSRTLLNNPKARIGLDYLGTGYTLDSNGASNDIRDSSPDTVAVQSGTKHLYNFCFANELDIVKV